MPGIAARWLAAAAVLGVCLATAPAGAADATKQVRIGPPPGWVAPAEVEAEIEPPPGVRGGSYWLLVDTQHHPSAAPAETFVHVARQIVDDEGVQSGSTISIEFDPAYERLTLHTIRLHRDGRTIDKLVPAAIKVLQRETRLEQDVYDGSQTAVVLLEDTRRGDVVEYSFSRRGSNPVFGRHYVDAIPLQADTPVKRLRFRLLWPAGAPLFTRSHGLEIEPVVRTEGRLVEYTWQRADVAAALLDGNLPDWYDPYPWLQLSDFRDWSAVAAWGVEHYTAGPDSGVRAKAAELRSAHAERDAQVREAIRFVQDEIRYLAIALGTGSHRPSRPAQVLDRRFGDCKDKSLLLVALLRALGVEADVALVDTQHGKRVDAQHPSPLAFDHAIVRFRLGDAEHWVDPTVRYQGGALGALALPDYGRALLLRPDSEQLTGLPPSRVASRTEVRQVLKVPGADGGEVAHFSVETTYVGADADDLRQAMRASSRDEMEKGYRDYYATLYPSIETAVPLDVRDDREANQLRTVETYRVRNFWQQPDTALRPVGEVYAIEIRGALPHSEAAGRTTPLRLQHPRHIVHETVLHFPKPWPVAAATVDITNGALRFSHRTTVMGRVVTLHNEFETLSDAIPAPEAAALARDVERIDDHLALRLYDEADHAVPRSLDEVNWPLAISAVLTLLLAAGAATTLLRSVRRAAPAGEAAPTPRPIGGWLVLLALGVAAMPLALVVDSLQLAPMLYAPLWRELTTPGTESYHALYAPLLMFETCVNVALLVGAVLIAILFFQQRRLFRPAYVLYLGITIAALAADLLFAQQVEPTTAADARDLPRSVLALLIWGTYLYRSERARATFVR